MASSTTLRLPDGLKSDAEGYAAALGISLNALCAVALRDYLDARRADLASALLAAVPGATAPAVRSNPAAVAQKVVVAPVVYAEPAAGVYALCPCRSGKKWKFCHGAT